MQIKNTADRYGSVAQLLHWSMVALIVMQFVLANQAADTESLLHKAKILTTHKSVGMSIFMLAVLRLVWRLANPIPAPVATTKLWQQRLGSAMHWALYALILLTPLAGWLMSSAKNYSVSWFGFFTFPDLVAPNEYLHEQFKEWHIALANTILF